MLYNPFVLVDAFLLAELRTSGYCNFVLQRLSWPGLASGQGFLLSPYREEAAAQQHAQTLKANEGKALKFPQDEERIANLLGADTVYRIFLNQIKEADWQKKMLKAYKNNITYYLGHKTAFKRKNSITIVFTLEHGCICAVISDGDTELQVPAIALIE